MKSMKLKCVAGGRLFLSCVLGFTIVTAMTAAVTTGPKAKAETSGMSTASITVSSTCTMSMVVNSPHVASVVASNYKADVGKTTISTVCNDVNGYSIYAIGYTNNEWGRNDMLGATTGRTIATGTATSGDTSNWAMKLTPVAGDYTPSVTTGYEAYHAVPNEYMKVASYNNTTGDSSSPSQLETTYAMYATGTQTPDTYNGKVKYTLVHSASSTEKPCMGTYTINYDANGGSGTMDSQTVCANKQVGLLPNGFTPPTPVTGYQFIGWNTVADGSGTKYTPGWLVNNLANIDSSVTLYAQWMPKYMQDLTTSMCSMVATDQQYTVYDRRDGNNYTVRYIEGACWMTQNLRITNVVTSEYSNFSTYGAVNVCEGDLTVGSIYSQPRCHDSGNATNGVWYNYAAASAKTITENSNSMLATEDICPAGWHLPSYDTNNPSGSINSLISTSSTSTAKFSPVSGGYYANGAYDGRIHQTDYGFWWTKTSSGASARYLLRWWNKATYVLENSNVARETGNYIRCVRTQ